MGLDEVPIGEFTDVSNKLAVSVYTDKYCWAAQTLQKEAANFLEKPVNIKESTWHNIRALESS